MNVILANKFLVLQFSKTFRNSFNILPFFPIFKLQSHTYTPTNVYTSIHVHTTTNTFNHTCTHNHTYILQTGTHTNAYIYAHTQPLTCHFVIFLPFLNTIIFLLNYRQKAHTWGQHGKEASSLLFSVPLRVDADPTCK